MASTTRYNRGDIVLVSFPFTDLSSSKRRPALVVSPDAFNRAMQDVVLAAITSQGADEASALTIEPGDCIDGILPRKDGLPLLPAGSVGASEHQPDECRHRKGRSRPSCTSRASSL